MKAQYVVIKEWKGFKSGEIITYNPEEGFIVSPTMKVEVTNNEVSKAIATNVLRQVSTF